MLSGCAFRHFRLFHPAGPLAQAEVRFTLIDVGVMLCLILPTFLMILWCLWRYRRTRQGAYNPKWSRSRPIEIAMWVIPFLTVAVLAFVSFRGVYQLDPYHPRALGTGPPLGPPLRVDVIATDWQWVFIYPKQHIATIDELVVPVGRNVKFRLTSTAVVNDFYIPQLAPMIDVMPGMRTENALRIGRPGAWRGFSANLSGAGFSWMIFQTRGVPPSAFKAWVRKVEQSPDHLTYARFETVAKPSINLLHTPAYFSAATPGLFRHVITAARAGKVYPVKEDLTKHMAIAARRHAAYLAAPFGR
ncbi:MAG: cytochrome C oxidase subunit II [Proteobacteria bacterium]|nr:cytochrome C oxidase subunit II [Pseudomonadota bacterium]